MGLTKEFYPSSVTAKSRDLLKEIQELAVRIENITLLGGWAVHSLVVGPFAIESQDIDLLIHSDKAWNACIDLLIERGGQWRIYRDKDGQRYKDHRIIFPKKRPLAVDIFYTNDVNHEMLRNLFATNWGRGFKEQKYIGFIPDLVTIIVDKFRTVGIRRETIKMIKDIMDIHALLFHNKAEKSIDEIWCPEIEEVAKKELTTLEGLQSDERISSEVHDIMDIIIKRVKLKSEEKEKE